MKILFLIASLRMGGAERVASTLCNHWAGDQHTVTLVTLDSQDQDFYQSHSLIKRYALDSYKSKRSILDKVSTNFSRIFKIRKIIQENQPDVVVAFMEVANFLAIIASLGTGIPVIISERTYPPYFHDGDWFDIAKRQVYKLASGFVAQTDKIADWARSFMPAKPIHILVNPLAAKALNTDLGLARDNIILGLGRLHPDKGFDLLIEAFKLCHQRFPDWKLQIVGSGAEQQKLMQLIASYGLTNQVELCGETDAPSQMYAQAKIYVLSSRVEGFPNVLIEAMANGLAVTSFDCNNGPADIIDNEVNGLLVANGQIDALALAMQRLMADDDLRDRLGSEAIKIKSKYDLENISQQWLGLFKQVTRQLA